MNIVCIVLLIVFLLFGLGCLFSEEYIAATVGFSMAALMCVIIFLIIKEEKTTITEDEPTPVVITNVINYQIDTNVVINDSDTLKTYTITYWSENN